MKLEVREATKAFDLAEFVHTLGRVSHTQGAALVKPHRSAGLFSEDRLVEPGTVGPHLHDGEIVRKMGAEAGGVPGRARSKLVLFDEYDVSPTKFGQVVEQRAPHRSAADHHSPRV